MCTVTYLPLSDGCLITSNRDEALARDRAEFPTAHDYKGQALLFPKDPRGQGSWIASNHASRCACSMAHLKPMFRRHLTDTAAA